MKIQAYRSADKSRLLTNTHEAMIDTNEPLTEDQKTKLQSFMAEHPEASEKVALRFLIGRKWELERVRKLYANYVKTVKERGLAEVTIKDVLEEMRTQKMYLPGSRARDESAIFVIWAIRHVPGQFKPEDTVKFAYYLSQVHVGEDALTMRKGLCLIVNLEGVEWGNSDVNFLKSIVDFFQDNIPAAVKHIVLWRAPWWISMLAKMVLPFLKEKMRQRIVITDDPEDLAAIIDPSQLPSEFPKGKFHYDHSAYIEKELAKVSATQMTLSPEDFKSALYSPPLVVPEGVEKMIDDDTARQLLKERKEMIEDLERMIRVRKQCIRGSGVPVDLARLASTRRGRLSLPLGCIDEIYHQRQEQVKDSPQSPISLLSLIDEGQQQTEASKAKPQVKERSPVMIANQPPLTSALLLSP